MALQGSGAISLADIRAEQGGSGAVSLGDSGVRTLLGVSSGAISLSNAYGKSAWQITYSGSSGSGVVTDGSQLSSEDTGATTLYLTSNVSCTWNISLTNYNGASYSSAPSSGQNTSNASFSASATKVGSQNKNTSSAQWSVSASYGGRTISFTVMCAGYGDNLDSPIN